jgi:hypothetical protein
MCTCMCVFVCVAVSPRIYTLSLHAITRETSRTLNPQPRTLIQAPPSAGCRKDPKNCGKTKDGETTCVSKIASACKQESTVQQYCAIELWDLKDVTPENTDAGSSFSWFSERSKELWKSKRWRKTSAHVNKIASVTSTSYQEAAAAGCYQNSTRCGKNKRWRKTSAHVSKIPSPRIYIFSLHAITRETSRTSGPRTLMQAPT